MAFTVLLIYALIFNVPLILLVWLTRNRFSPLLLRFLLAIGFALATVYWIWRLEWTDVFQHGIPRVGDLLISLPYVGAVALMGWFLAALLAPRHSRAAQDF
jgi:hypothetical protein